jgi:hypothetical protein
MVTNKKPAATKPAKGTQPAETEPAVKEGFGIKDLAADLGKSEKATRAAIRRHLGGAQVGQGGRYHWDSKEDAQYVELLSALGSAPSEDA